MLALLPRGSGGKKKGGGIECSMENMTMNGNACREKRGFLRYATGSESNAQGCLIIASLFGLGRLKDELTRLPACLGSIPPGLAADTILKRVRSWPSIIRARGTSYLNDFGITVTNLGG